jgi:hypothetical protein
MKLITSLLQRLYRPSYQIGQTITRFIARDVRREVEIIDNSRLDEGFITARVRTTNILYQMSGLVPESQFDEPREIAISELWGWSGNSWGGLPDGTSLVGTHTITSKRDT